MESDEEKIKKPTEKIKVIGVILTVILTILLTSYIYFVMIPMMQGDNSEYMQPINSGIVYDKNENVISWGQSKTIIDSYDNIIYTRDTCLIYLADSTQLMSIHSDYNDCTQEDIRQWSNAQGYNPTTSTSTVKTTQTTSKVDNTPIWNEASRLNDLCGNEIDTANSMSKQIWGENGDRQVSDANLIKQMAEQRKYQDSVCLDTVNYLLKYRDILDYGQTKAWATIAINRYIDNNKQHEIWYQQINNIAALNVHITWISWTVTKVTYIEKTVEEPYVGSALSPARDLTGSWSGTSRHTDNTKVPSYTAIGKVTMTIQQTGNKFTGTYNFRDLVVTSDIEELNSRLAEGDIVGITGTISGTRIEFTDSYEPGWIRYSGSFTTDMLKINYESCSLSEICYNSISAKNTPSDYEYVGEPGIKGVMTLTRDRT